MKNIFAHLHVHNEYSQLDGFGTAKKYAMRAKQMGFRFLGLTNHGNIDGLIDFQNACREVGISPIMGCEGYIVPDARIKEPKENRGHIIILIKNQRGFEAVCRLLTYANLTGFYRKPRFDFNSVLNEDVAGLVFMTACGGSFLRLRGGPEFLLDLTKITDDVYFEIMPHNINIQHEIHRHIKSLRSSNSKFRDIPLVATNDCHYINKDEWENQEILLAIQSKAKWNDKDRFRFGFRGLHLRSVDEMMEAFKIQGDWKRQEYFSAIRNSIYAAKKCAGFEIKKQTISLPSVKEGWEEEEHYEELAQLAWEGLKKLNLNEDVYRQYQERLDEELSLIKKKKFAKYFLIVHRLIDWARNQKIMVGPGRGSVGGSLVAYTIGITAIDPIKYGLLFERFIAQDRIDYPDIDIDFEDDRRDEVIAHLQEVYGKYNTCGISTFGRMKARAVIRDIGRVFDISYQEIDRFAKAIPMHAVALKDNETLIEYAVANTSEGKIFARKYPDIVRHAIRLEGQIRNSGQHAAAVIISAEDLRNGKRCNLCIRKNRIMSNWDMSDAEYCGLMKLDILGLNTLTVLNECKRLINDPEFDFKKIPLNDKKVFRAINKGQTFGIFQLSAPPTTELAKEIKVDSLEDIAAVIALVRPGPFDSGMTKEYIKRKKMGRWEKKNKIYEKITKGTYGILVYQEQVMKVISEVAGLSYSMADEIRKTIAKKRDPKMFEKYWELFLEGCLKNKTMSKKEAEEFWAGLQKWANYGFNMSHSIEYALIAYWTAWMKVNYPTEFICAYLSFGTELGKEELIKEAVRSGITLVLPKVGISDSHRWIAKDQKLYVPFIEVKGIGDKAAIQCASKPKQTAKDNRAGFFLEEKCSLVAKRGSALDKLLRRINAYDSHDLSFPPSAQELFSFALSGERRHLYPNLFTLFPRLDSTRIDDYLRLDLPSALYPKRLVKKGKGFVNKKILKCHDCQLRDECRAPVLPSQGILNTAIIGEAPGPQEDRQRRGFYEKAPSGKLLWEAIERRGYRRALFHVTNVCKCYPRKSKTPNTNQIRACSHWLYEELKEIDCRIVLACGNSAVKALTERKSGITKIAGTSEWIEKLGLWACWCIHPSAIARNPWQKKLFIAGVDHYIDKLEKGGFMTRFKT